MKNDFINNANISIFLIIITTRLLEGAIHAKQNARPAIG